MTRVALDWAGAHREELRQEYDGKVVVVHIKMIVGSGDSCEEALAKARRQGRPPDKVGVMSMLAAGAEFHRLAIKVV